MIRERILGRTGFEVSELGYGAWGIGQREWIGAEDEQSMRSLHLAVEKGVTFFDTALAYGDGHSEQLVGRLLREVSEPLRVATKVPPRNRRWPAAPDIPVGRVFPGDYVVECAEAEPRKPRGRRPSIGFSSTSGRPASSGRATGWRGSSG